MSPSEVTGYGIRKGQEGTDSERQEYPQEWQEVRSVKSLTLGGDHQDQEGTHRQSGGVDWPGSGSELSTLHADLFSKYLSKYV